MRRTARISVAALAVTTLALTACGRGDDAATGDASAAAVDTGELSGTVTVWAMGTEGEKLGDFAEAFTEENPDVDGRRHRGPLGRRARQDRHRDRRRRGARRLDDRHHVDGRVRGERRPRPDAPDLIDESAFFAGAWGSTEVGGTSYGVPWYVETRVLYVDTALAEQAGVSPTPATGTT